MGLVFCGVGFIGLFIVWYVDSLVLGFGFRAGCGALILLLVIFGYVLDGFVWVFIWFSFCCGLNLLVIGFVC